MFLSIGMLKQKYFLADIFILSAEKQPIKLSWRKIECLPKDNSIFRVVEFKYAYIVYYKEVYNVDRKRQCIPPSHFLRILL